MGAQALYNLTIQVRQVGTSTPVNQYKFIVNADNTGDPFAANPDHWPSLRATPSYSPVVAAGDQNQATVSLPQGKYLVSVRAPGYKLGGQWVNLTNHTTVTVYLHKHPLPLAKIRVHVFEDNRPINGEDDFPMERGLPGFQIIIKDAVGEVTVDYFGNPLGGILTDNNGDALIENLPPGKYAVQAIPPDGSDWIQTTTIEGTYEIDAWIEEGNTGYLSEEGFTFPLVWIGFVRPKTFAPGAGTGVIKGRALTIVDRTAPGSPIPLFGPPVPRLVVGLTDLGRNDEQVYTGRGQPDGTFIIENVPAGVYQLALWDEPLDYIISFWTVIVNEGETVDLGDLGLPRWFGWIKGRVFHDQNSDGRQDPEEIGIANITLNTRYKDGSIQYSTITNIDGEYSFDEIKELPLFTVLELGYDRFQPTVALAVPDAEGPAPPSPQIFPQTLTLATLTWAGQTNRVDWGLKEYSGEANGGISGVVYYAVMRNELDPRYAVAESYEPGLPGVTVKLYQLSPNGTPVLIKTTTTDSWQHPTGCPAQNNTIEPNCPELPLLNNQIKPGTFDGGYMFTDLKPGKYLVEVVPPPFYKILTPDATNTDEGDQYTAPQYAPPPYYQDKYNAKLVTLNPGQNAVADFFLYTDVPIPGRIKGQLVDDLNLDLNPNSKTFGEKKGIPYCPIGIRDFRGRLLKTVYTDAYGYFEVLLPSTYTANVPTPSGLSPGMYRIVGNDPGTIANPNANYNPNYQTLPLVFDVWPGKTTFADVAVFPTAALPGFPQVQSQQSIDRSQFPYLGSVDRVVITTTNRHLVIRGQNFGSSAGKVTLNGIPVSIISWENDRVEVRVPRNFPAGPAQLLLTTAKGLTCINGITVHVIGSSYDPPIYTVTPQTTIQSIIDQAPAGSLIIVAPGTYYESPIIYKPLKLQGLGPEATIIDGRFFMEYEEEWTAKLSSLAFDGPERVSRGQVITVVAKDGQFNASFRTQIDGLQITGARGTIGGGIVLHAYCRYTQISNNLIKNNGGGFGGAITVGQPYVGDNHNEGIKILHNLIIGNGGTSRAGGIGLFAGAHNYEFAYNEVKHNYSAEYGGGFSHYGLSQGGKIHHNYFLFNSSFDEGGGIFIGGEQPLPPNRLSPGSGEVEIYNNLLQGNLANDDGGGIRLLKPGTYKIRIYNNMITNNVSTDLGGGIALDDAADVEIINNTIAKNITTATAEDSDRLPHGAGLVSEMHSADFLASLPPGAPDFSDPILFNNIFWDNRAGRFDPAFGIVGIGLSGDPSPVKVIDLEVYGAPSPRVFSPKYCCLTKPYDGADATNVYADPLFIAPYDTTLIAKAMNTQPNFIDVKITSDPNLIGDYHLQTGSPLLNHGTPVLYLNNRPYLAPLTDFDDEDRARGSGIDLGADEA